MEGLLYGVELLGVWRCQGEKFFLFCCFCATCLNYKTIVFIIHCQDIRIPPKNMWKPDILLYNRLVFSSSINEIRFAIVANENYFSANENFDATFPTKIVVSHNGDISQIPPGCEEEKMYK